MKKQLINEVKQLQKIAGLLKESVDKAFPFSETNIFLPNNYLVELDELVDTIKSQHGNNPKLSKAVDQFVDVLEVGWRYYDDTFDGEFDGDAANMDIEDARTSHNGEEISYTSVKEQLDNLVPGFSGEIEDLFMDGKQEYYEGVNELHPDKEWDEEEDEEEPYENDMDNLDTSLPK